MNKKLRILFFLLALNFICYAQNYDSLARLFDEALEFPEKTDSSLAVLNDLHRKSIHDNDSNLLGFVNYHKARLYLIVVKEYSIALEYYIDALRIFEKLNNQKSVNASLLQIGLIHYTQKNYEEAIKWFEEVRIVSNLDSNHRRMATALYLQALSEIEIERYDKATNNLRSAVEIYLEVDYEQGRIEALSGLAIIHLKKGNGDSALYYLQSNVEFFRRKNDADALLSTYILVSEAHLLNNEISQAISFAEQALEQGNKLINEKRNTGAYQVLYKSLAAAGRYKEAYFYADKYNRINEQTYNEENYNRILHLKTQYEKENIERNYAIEQARKEEINLALVNREKLFRNFFFICFLLVLIIIIILFNRYKVKNTKNKALAETLDKLKKTQNQLLHHEKLASLGRLMAGIAHEIQNPLNFVNNFSELSKGLIKEYNHEKDTNEKEEIMKELYSNMDKINFHGKRADSIVRNMLQHGRKSDAVKQATDINQLSTEFLNFAYYGYKAAHKEINIEIEKKLSPAIPPINIIQQDLSRVLINLFNNSFDAIHHKIMTNTNGYIPKLVLETTLSNNKVLIKIRDNGTGISEDIMEKVFDPFFTTKPAGAGTGLGLSISNDIVLAHGGRIDIASDINKFTEVTVELPVN